MLVAEKVTEALAAVDAILARQPKQQDALLIKADVLAGKTVAGAMVFEFFSPGMSAILANAGCKFVLYDMEHTGLGFETLKWLFSSCRGLPIEPMVRVPRGEYTFIARALDLGARGVMIPMVESAEQARSIVQACRYPPAGRRGAAFGFAQCDYLGGDVGDKIRRYHQRTLVIAQIETERGLDQVEQIAAVDGIDKAKATEKLEQALKAA